jgi:predicted ATPase
MIRTPARSAARPWPADPGRRAHRRADPSTASYATAPMHSADLSPVPAGAPNAERPDMCRAVTLIISEHRRHRSFRDKSTITDYVVTEPLARNFDKALDLIKSALEVGASRAAYLNGSFGSGKWHFMAVLYAILMGDPDARGKKGLADVVAKHDRSSLGSTSVTWTG